MPEIDVFGGLGRLSEPFTKLIEVVGSALERHGQPRLIERTARAEVRAELIRAEGEIRRSEIYERAATRLVKEEILNQENIETVLAKSAEHLAADSRPEDMSADWIRLFLDRAKFVSEDDAQSLWAKLMAGEANSPGTFGKRTIDILASLEQEDAEAFERLISCSVGQPDPVPIVFRVGEDVYASAGIKFYDVVNLEQLGLISFNHLTGFARTVPNRRVVVQYFGQVAVLDLKGSDSDTEFRLEAGAVLLTRAGTQLARLIEGVPVDGFFDYILAEWEKKGQGPSSCLCMGLGHGLEVGVDPLGVGEGELGEGLLPVRRHGSLDEPAAC